ncbi:hypothetical protein [uncultured Maritalea sp.]|uniref:hypothetical protein n=1 Tax=uncultured Maritalea sp. TaxID=757249 RepID=UPI002633427A|nr:hypothetical protein [uncultured Maritalea sp.]
MIEYLGLIAVIIMVGSYALEDRHPLFVLLFAFGCAMAAFYAWLIGSVPFLIAEGIWAIIAFTRWLRRARKNSRP